MLIVSDETDRSLSGFGAAVPRFSFAEPTFAQMVVEQVAAEQYSLAHFRIHWFHVKREEIHDRAAWVWARKRSWYCTFV